MTQPTTASEPDICTCRRCGYQWKRGLSGAHECADYLERQRNEAREQVRQMVACKTADDEQRARALRLIAEQHTAELQAVAAEANEARALCDTLGKALEETKHRLINGISFGSVIMEIDKALEALKAGREGR